MFTNSLPLAVRIDPTEALPPLWIFSLGVAAGLALLLVGWGAMAIVAPRAARRVLQVVREGVLWPISIVLLVFAAFAFVGWLAVRSPGEMFGALSRITDVGETRYSFDIPSTIGEEGGGEEGGGAEAAPYAAKIPVSFRANELVRIEFQSTQHLLVSVEPQIESKAPIDVPADKPRVWVKAEEMANPFTEGVINELYVQNLGDRSANLTMTVTTDIAFPQMRFAPFTALCVVTGFLLYLLQSWLMPKISAVALSTYKSEIAQPLFWILVALGVLGLIASVFIPYFTMGEDIKMLKNASLEWILVLTIVLAVWAASNSIAEEIEGRTALTVLSKPLGRRGFIIGKFLGISWTVVLMYVILGAVLLATVAYKPLYDGGESSRDDITWLICFQEMKGIVPGLALGLLETLLLTAVSVAISTRLPLVANFSITAVVYALGHLTPLIVLSSVGRFTPVRFVGQLIATVFPVLDHLNIQAAIATGAQVPAEYMGWALLYTLLFGAIAMLLALLFFEDRDLT